MSFIYKIINKINGKIYIGKTNRTIEERFKEHCKDYLRRDWEKRPLYRAMKKYGIQNFEIEEIEECNIDIADERERYWIEYYGSFKNGYNATIGGDGKSYIDRKLVIKTYEEVQNQNQVAKICGISPDSVSSILRGNHINILPSSEVCKRISSRSVAMLDINTKQIIKTFSSQSDAARWLIQEKKTTIEDTTKISYIVGRVVRGLRKSAYGYIWKHLED